MKLSDVMLDGFLPDEDDPVNIKLIIFKYLKRWYFFLIGIISCLGLGYLYMQWAVPQYSVSSTILINVEDKGSSFSKNAVFSDLENYQSSKIIDNEIEILKSASLMRLVMARLPVFHTSVFVKDNLIRERELFAYKNPLNIVIHEYDTMAFATPDVEDTFTFIFKGNTGFEIEDEAGKRTSHEFGKEVRNFYGSFTVLRSAAYDVEEIPEVRVKFNNVNGMAAKYAASLDIEPTAKLASVLTLSLTDPVKEKGHMILNNLVEIYNEEASNAKNQIAENTMKFIDEQLYKLVEDLTEVETQVENYKRDNRITNISSEASEYLSSTSAVQKQLSEYTIQLQVLESIEGYMVSQEDDYQMVPSNLTIQDATLMNLINNFNDLQSERERMLRTTQPNNPLVRNLSEQMSNLRKNILENLRQIKRGLEIASQNLQSSSYRYESKSQMVPAIERQLLEISRKQSVMQENYLYLTKKRDEAALSLAASTVSNSRIIDPPADSGMPVKPKKLLIYVFSFLMGLAIPFGIIYAKDKVNDKILLKYDVQKITKLPILGEISHHDGNNILAISNKIRTPVAEQFRLIRSNLQFAIEKSDSKVILVTSSMSGEGKTFFSLNFGVSQSLTGKKVVILEFDLRKPALLKKLGMYAEKGISDYLNDDNITVGEITKPVKLAHNIDVIGCGNIPDNPSELMMYYKVEDLILNLKENYDVIILDTAPVGQVADAFSLSKYIDLSIYLVRYNYTLKNQLNFVVDLDKNKKLKKPMLVLNDAKFENGYGYTYGYGLDGSKKSYFSSKKKVS